MYTYGYSTEARAKRRMRSCQGESQRVEEALSATAAGEKPQYTTENRALTGVGQSGEVSCGGQPAEKQE